MDTIRPLTSPIPGGHHDRQTNDVAGDATDNSPSHAALIDGQAVLMCRPIPRGGG